MLLRRQLKRVYPRVGGGNCGMTSLAQPVQGLSPRGRGKLYFRRMALSLLRSIPAWAGETELCMCRAALYWVYPRVGGGNSRIRSVAFSYAGLSPRGRGKRRY